MVNLTINNKKIQVPEGTTILAAAAQAGIKIPTLCYLKEINEIVDTTLYSFSESTPSLSSLAIAVRGPYYES